MSAEAGPKHCYLLRLAYDGFGFSGWQTQKNASTLQGVLESALSSVFDQPIRVVAAGRTDAGVHALDQAVHFKTSSYRQPRALYEALRTMLPQCMSVRCVSMVEPEFHARFWALRRTYVYWVRRSERHDPFLSRLCWRVSLPLNFDAIRKGLDALVGTHDFSAFAVKSPGRNPRVTMDLAKVFDLGDENAYFVFRASHFLRKMVRILLAGLIELGLGRLVLQDLKASLETGVLAKHVAPAPPGGLFLAQVLYPADVRVFERYPAEAGDEKIPGILCPQDGHVPF
jgi:tRNA pseudouridine38-40 synthase